MLRNRVQIVTFDLNGKQPAHSEEPMREEQDTKRIDWGAVITAITGIITGKVSEYHSQKVQAVLQQFKRAIRIFAAILISTTLLTCLKILSSDLVAFIIGAIVGYIGETLRVLAIAKEKGEE